MTQLKEEQFSSDRELLTNEESRPWAVKALMLLLFVHAAALFGIAVFSFVTGNLAEIAQGEASITFILGQFTAAILFTALALLALVAALSFMGLWRTGWSIAMLVQGLVLLTALILHFRVPHFYVYPLMAYSIFMVIYLHHPDVQDTFQVRTELEEIEESG